LKNLSKTCLKLVIIVNKVYFLCYCSSVNVLTFWGVSMNKAEWRDRVWTMMLCFCAVYAVMLLPDAALAGVAGGGTIGNLLCNVAKWFTGPVGQGIATLAIIVVGLGALMGKVSWGMAIIVGIGVAVIFGAPAIVSELGAGGSGCA
jgi:type IV secretion system protein VirB2